MRKIIFAINTTLDGFFDHTAMIADDELHEKASDLFKSADVILFGRVMYQLMEEYWPTATSDPSLSPSVREFAETINAANKIVFTKTLTRVSWNTKIMARVDPTEIGAMKRQPGKDILLGGGATLANAFMQLNLIDEYRLIIHPVLLGKGKKLFQSFEDRKDLRLSGHQERTSGVVELIYSTAVHSSANDSE